MFFEVLHDVTFTSLQPVRTVTARQTVRIDSKELPQVSDGQPLQLFPLDDGFFAAPPERRQRRPQVLVAGEPWEYRPYLRKSQGTDKHFTFKPWLESIAFGDGRNGAIPQAGAIVEVTYHSTSDEAGCCQGAVPIRRPALADVSALPSLCSCSTWKNQATWSQSLKW